MALLDLLGRKWALRILWELRGHPLHFRTLRSACDDLSPTVLNRRLKELIAADIVALQPGEGYLLTPEGRELILLLAPLNQWSKKWKKRVQDK